MLIANLGMLSSEEENVDGAILGKRGIYRVNAMTVSPNQPDTKWTVAPVLVHLWVNPTPPLPI